MFYPIVSPALVALAIIVMSLAVSRARDLSQRVTQHDRARPNIRQLAEPQPAARGGLRSQDDRFFDAVSALHYEVG